MTPKLKQLLDLVEQGCVVMYYGPYVDGFLSIYQNDEDKWVYKSQVWAETPLEELPLSRVSVYQPILNWEEVEISPPSHELI